MYLREDKGPELMRFYAQAVIICGFLSAFGCLLAAPGSLWLLGEWPWNVPFMLYRDTFGVGVTAMILQFKAPLLTRTRYEAPGNFWHPFLFSSENLIGQAQDLAFHAWNWLVQLAFEGPVLVQLLFVLGAAMGGSMAAYLGFTVAQSFLYGTYKLIWENGPKMHRKLKINYLLLMPEGLLVLGQLMMIEEEKIGRKLSAKAKQEISACAEEPPKHTIVCGF